MMEGTIPNVAANITLMILKKRKRHWDQIVALCTTLTLSLARRCPAAKEEKQITENWTEIKKSLRYGKDFYF